MLQVDSTYSYKQQGITSTYSTEQIDKDTMTEFVQSQVCCQVVLGRYFDGNKQAGQDY